MSAAAAFEVFEYSLDQLARIIAEGSHQRSVDEIRKKRHVEYVDGYLREIGVASLIVERDYIDRDYLEDFAAYYVRCFEEYRKKCLRIHFFSAAISRDDLTACLTGAPDATLSKSYLGFIVVKPLPRTVIGRTCLITYCNKAQRHYPAARKFESNLFGVPLSIANTLPFQEQDSVVAACATSALWTLFQATAREFEHQVLTPIEITRAATHLLPTESRVIPNQGLSTHMMAHAIKSVNLEPFLIRVAEDKVFHAAIYSYVRARIPLLLGVDLLEQTADDLYKPMGKHALAIVGYNLGGSPTPLSASGLVLRSSRMDKIYVHDDQIGPFARMELDGKRIKVEKAKGDVREATSLSTSWPGAGEVRAVPDILLVPLYHKVRLSWEWTLKRVTEINEMLMQFTRAHAPLKANQLEWDVYLTTVNEVRHSLRASSMNADEKLASVTRPMPKFIWRATALRDDLPVMDVLFDATDIDSSDALIQALIHDWNTLDFIKNLANAGDIDQLPFDNSALRLMHWVHEHY